MTTTNIKKDLNNIELTKLAAKNLGLKTETLHSSPKKTLLYVTDGSTFYLASQASPGMFPAANRWNAHFSGSKLLAQKILKRLGYNVIPSKEIRVNEFSSAKALKEKLAEGKFSFPILVKPDKGMNAKNIAICENHAHLAKVAAGHYRDKKDFMIQPIISDKVEYRIMIVNNKLVLMHSKDTYHVKGDGKSTIRQLLSEIVPARTDATCIAWQHKKLGTKATTILKKDIKFEYHLTKGAVGASYYKTDKFPAATKKWALQLAKDISAPVVGLDVFITGENFDNTDKYTIIEVNTNPGLHYFVGCFNDGKIGLAVFTSVLKDFFKIK